MMVFVKIFKTLFENFLQCFFFSPDEVAYNVQSMRENGLEALVEHY